MDLSDLSRPIHRLIPGPTGSGKSYFVGSQVEQLRRGERPFIIMDMKKSHGGLISLPGVVRVVIRPGDLFLVPDSSEYPVC
ncbi:DNA helicase HerA-like ATPase [Methanocalculus alkaliphilus]|uniref:ATP-binding protein n=1 Tax=Methanocalculus alkaliphilus TaxID=768730 RepID=UPI00209D1D81|nr:ATP-binding protein [Methanocalculus alkaliphilus]MCP1715677.1 DNA helicase HerA-like ATPase [Methanocalculus alkaliphilus]